VKPNFVWGGDVTEKKVLGVEDQYQRGETKKTYGKMRQVEWSCAGCVVKEDDWDLKKEERLTNGGPPNLGHQTGGGGEKN